MNLAPLIKILPGTLSELRVGSRLPENIVSLLDHHTKQFDSMLLVNGDVWRYFDSYDQIFTHPKLVDKKVFLQTLGYSNKYFGNNKWELSYPGWYWTRRKIQTVFEPIKKAEYGFSCLNNNTSIHRLLLGYNLYSRDLLNTVIFSQNNLNDYAINRALQDVPGFISYKELLPIRCPEDTLQDFANDHAVAHSAYTNAYCNIVTESECEEYPYNRNINLPVITEKSYKPFRSKQIPIMFAAQGHVKYLQGLGFEMMTDLLPLNYDNMPVPEKINVICDTVSKGKEFIQDFYYSHLQEIQHNYELVNGDQVESLILQRISDTINDI
jgi:hypothetical protein